MASYMYIKSTLDHRPLIYVPTLPHRCTTSRPISPSSPQTGSATNYCCWTTTQSPQNTLCPACLLPWLSTAVLPVSVASRCCSRPHISLLQLMPLRIAYLYAAEEGQLRSESGRRLRAASVEEQPRTEGGRSTRVASNRHRTQSPSATWRRGAWLGQQFPWEAAGGKR